MTGSTTQYRDRIVGLRRVKASELIPDDRNWRTHPESQRRAFRRVLEDVGLVAAVVVRQREDGALVVIDGHLRREEAGDREVTVLVTDLTEEEAGVALATFDPLAAMATGDPKVLQRLLTDLRDGSPGLMSVLELVGQGYGLVPASPPEPPAPRPPRPAREAAPPSPEAMTPARTAPRRPIVMSSPPDPDLARMPDGMLPDVLLVMTFDLEGFAAVTGGLDEVAEEEGLPGRPEALAWLCGREDGGGA